jgi:putative tryptophan/tyrosine transport system substrate-binding protein
LWRCRTGLHVVDGDLSNPVLPIVPGHEIVGHVRALPASADLPSTTGSGCHGWEPPAESVRTAAATEKTAPYYGLYLQSINAAVPAVAVESIAASVHSQADIENVIRKVGGESDGGLFVLPDSHNVVHRQRIIELAAQYRLPTIYYFRYFASDGGLISYGPDEMDLFRRTAGYVGRILKGAKPSDLPVQQPTRFELVINLKTAKAMGIQMPVSLLARANEVIE